MLSKLLCAKRRKSHNSTKYCEGIIKSVEIKQMAIQHYSYDQHLSQFWNHLVKYFITGRPIQTDNSNGIGGGRTTRNDHKGVAVSLPSQVSHASFSMNRLSHLVMTPFATSPVILTPIPIPAPGSIYLHQTGTRCCSSPSSPPSRSPWLSSSSSHLHQVSWSGLSRETHNLPCHQQPTAA